MDVDSRHPVHRGGVALPALLSAARRPYGRAIRAALDAAGMGDMPPRGAFVVGAVARRGTAMQALPEAMGVSKQAVSQIVDVLVARGYLERATDPADRRRISLALTDRGREAAGVIRRAVAGVDRRLAARIGAADVDAARRALDVLAGL